MITLALFFLCLGMSTVAWKVSDIDDRLKAIEELLRRQEGVR